MRRTTVTLPDDVLARLRSEAGRQGVSVSALTSDAVAAYLDAADRRRPLVAAAAGASGQSDVAERIEQILETELGVAR
jgi:hypothetical protein